MPSISSLKISENGKKNLIFADFSNMKIGKKVHFEMLSLQVRAQNVDKLHVVKLFPIWVIFWHFQCVRVYNTR